MQNIDPAAASGAATLIEQLQLQPHPEGGFYREVYREPAADGARPAVTSIYYLLEAGAISAWHRVDATEIWHFHGGAPLELSWREQGGGIRTELLGFDLVSGARPQWVIPADCWQTARSLADRPDGWTLVGCTVAPGFEFSGFDLAPEGWSPEQGD